MVTSLVQSLLPGTQVSRQRLAALAAIVIVSACLPGVASEVSPQEIPELEAQIADKPNDGRLLLRYSAALFVAYCWGDNQSGQLGDGSNTQRLVPTAVLGGTSIVFLDSGDQYTCVVTFAGAGKCWGANADGQLGDGTTVANNAPVAVFGGLTLDGISTGSRFSCATSSGAVYCWGNNGSGQLGNGTNINGPTPVLVTGGWILPDLGTGVSEHMCAVTGSGAMLCWGQGLNGRLGNGGTANSNVPVLVSGT